jgi:hypothetical protein
MHHELATRPPTWSAKKDGKNNGYEEFGNPNAMPLGQRRAAKRALAEDCVDMETDHFNGLKKVTLRVFLVWKGHK